MKQLLTVLLSLIMISCGSTKYVDHSTSWVSAAKMENIEVFVDTASIKRDGTKMIAREKKIYYTDADRNEYLDKIEQKYKELGKTDKIQLWDNFSYTIYTSEYDCLNSQLRIIQVEDFDDQGNRIIKTTPNKKTDNWVNVDEETLRDYTFFFVCDYNN